MPKENTKQAVAEIRAAGVEVSISPEDLFGASLDHTRYSFMPDARVWVRNGEEIAFVLKTANEQSKKRWRNSVWPEKRLPMN